MENLPQKTNERSDFLAIIERLSADQDVDVDKIQRIIEMQERVLDRNAKQSFNTAMVRAQAKMPIVPRDRDNTQTKSKYSAYETLLKFTKPIYTEEGFAISMYEGETAVENNIRVCGDVMHQDGWTKTYWTDIPLDDKGFKGTPNKTQTHAKGSSLSYGKSYLLRLIFNIPTGDDDDGNSAGIEFITEDQVSQLEEMLKSTKANKEKFLAFMQVEELRSIPAKNFEKGKTALRDFERANKK